MKMMKFRGGRKAPADDPPGGGGTGAPLHGWTLCLLVLAGAFLLGPAANRLLASWWSEAVGAGFLAGAALDLLRSRRRSRAGPTDAKGPAAAAADQARANLLRGAGHDIRTPLNGIIGLAEVVELSGPHAESDRYGAMIRESATKLHGMLNAALDLGRATAWSSPAPTPIDPGELLRGIALLHADAAARRGAHVETGGDAPRLLADRPRLSLLLNTTAAALVQSMVPRETLLLRAASDDAGGTSFTVARIVPAPLDRAGASTTPIPALADWQQDLARQSHWRWEPVRAGEAGAGWRLVLPPDTPSP